MHKDWFRTICPSCKESYRPDEEVCQFLGVDANNPPPIYRGKGCKECNYNGYKGRLGIYEVIEIDEKLRHLIHKQEGEMELEAEARRKGPSINQDGIAKVLSGQTTVEEVIRVTHRE